ncbi:MAG: alpha/beta fold hydrolase [Dehalococcoidales bacterium]|jgi:pimeloyl-ACP methyl ester carboxylesterase
MDNMQGKTIKVDGRDVLYYTAGRGEPLVVIHGGGGDARTWRKNIGALAEKYTVYAPDLPGYGGSQRLDGDYYIPELTDFVDKFAGSLGLETFYIIGHSLGGGIALDYTLKFPHKIRKLVLVSSLCLGREIAFWLRLFTLPAIMRSLGAMVEFIFKSIIWAARSLNPAKYIMPLSPASVAIGGNISSFREQTLVLEKRLPDIKVPTLLVWGGRDPVVPVKQAYRAAMSIPDCRIEVFKKSGHNVHREQLKKFSSLITGFLG